MMEQASSNIVIAWPGIPERAYLQRRFPRTGSESPLSMEEELILALHTELQRLQVLILRSPLMLQSPCPLCGHDGPGYVPPYHRCDALPLSYTLRKETDTC